MKHALIVTSYKLPSELLAAFNRRNEGWHIISVGDDQQCDLAYHGEDDGIFSIGAAANIGIKEAVTSGYDIIVKTDIDCILPDPETLGGVLSIGRGACFRYWQIKGDKKRQIEAAKLDHRRIGTLAMTAKDWEKAGYYQADLRGYGYDDFAVVLRARAAWVNVPIIINPKVLHIEHEPHNRATYNPLMRNENMRKSRS